MSTSKTILTIIMINSVALIINGCATTHTTKSLISDDTIKAMTDAVSKLDKEQVKKLETAIKEKLKDAEKTNQETVQENGSTKTDIDSVSHPTTTEQQGTTTTEAGVSDAFPIENLTFNIAVDSPQLANHYTGFQNQEHPWALMSGLPVTVTIKKFDASGIELDGVPQGKFENDRWERTSTFWAFDENGVELGYEDHAAPSYEQPSRFYGRAKYILVVRCSDSGSTFHAIARSRVMEVK